MPTYDYKCLNCGTKEEQQKLVKERDVAECSKCGFGLTRLVSLIPVHFLGPNWSWDGYDENSAPCLGNSDNPAYDDIMGAKAERMQKSLKENHQ